eukprot:scaffold141916_cov151-Phaeocystis_antarctica.AAC.1
MHRRLCTEPYVLPQPVRCLSFIANCCADPTRMTLCIGVSATSQKCCSYVLPQPVRCLTLAYELSRRSNMDDAMY